MPHVRGQALQPAGFAYRNAGFFPVTHRRARTERPGKRPFDLVLAIPALMLLTPLLLTIALLVRLDSTGPVLFRQQRIGRNGVPFTILKFRTMTAHAAPPGICPQACRDDPRVTRLGAWLRRSSLDELPQLINVIRGEMSLVGPRPHAPGTCAGGRLFEDVSPRYAARHRVTPGITGLAQIRGWRGETDTEEKLLCRLDADMEYIDTWSLAGDIAILCRTVAAVLRMRNAW
jgi:polysaccharide biosynthesis protein PslA